VSDAPRRQPYEKPALLVVQLEAKEVLATGCKLNTPNSGPIGLNCAAVPCVNVGTS
jgi:hypothetical protein